MRGDEVTAALTVKPSDFVLEHQHFAELAERAGHQLWLLFNGNHVMFTTLPEAAGCFLGRPMESFTPTMLRPDKLDASTVPGQFYLHQVAPLGSA